jgi:hypothetical protein
MPLIGKDKSPKLGSFWSFTAGFALLAVACGLLCLDIVALHRGEIWKFSKHNPGLVARSEHPGSFWFSAAFSFIISFFLAGNAIWILKDVFQKNKDGAAVKNSEKVRS